MLRLRSCLSTISFCFVLILCQAGGAQAAAPRLALIIDDGCGGTWGQTKKALDLAQTIPMALSVLPNGEKSCRDKLFSSDWGKASPMLHMPMQPIGHANPGNGAIRTGDAPQDIVAKLEAAHKEVPGAKGMNNHMGSAASNDPGIMRTVLNWARARGLFYIDSATAPMKACDLALPDMTCARNSVFLDHTDSVRAVGASLKKARRLSVKTGRPVIIIGHPHPHTMAVLHAFIKLKPDEFVPIERVLGAAPVAEEAR